MIKNKCVKGCIICQNARLSTEIDPILFEAKMNIKELREFLMNKGIFIDIPELKTHVKHIFFESDDRPTLEQEIDCVNKLSNIDLIKEALAVIRMKKKRLIKEGQDESQEFDKLVKTESEVLSLKAKMEGELVDKHEFTMPEWIKPLIKENG